MRSKRQVAHILTLFLLWCQDFK